MSNNMFSPLSSKIAVDSKAVKLESVSFVGKINLRIKEEDSVSRKIVSEFLRYNLPNFSGEVQGNNETRTAWLGPNEFLIHCLDEEKFNIINKIRDILGNGFYSVTDVSDYYITIRLSGEKSIEVLSKGCPLNFKQYLNIKDSCAQSYISKASVFIDRLADDQIFDISVRWSFAEYLWDWLEDASKEFLSSH
jgi:sarcosine oxidase subunit gamma